MWPLPVRNSGSQYAHCAHSRIRTGDRRPGGRYRPVLGRASRRCLKLRHRLKRRILDQVCAASSPSTAHAKFWWDGGITTTTVHYTNPCNSIKSATVLYINHEGDKYTCITALPKSTASKKILHGLFGAVKKLKAGC